jgi:hypothetical protein
MAGRGDALDRSAVAGEEEQGIEGAHDGMQGNTKLRGKPPAGSAGRWTAEWSFERSPRRGLHQQHALPRASAGQRTYPPAARGQPDRRCGLNGLRARRTALRATGGKTYHERAVKNAAHHYATWKKSPAPDLITQAHWPVNCGCWSMTPVGVEFWKRSDKAKAAR